MLWELTSIWSGQYRVNASIGDGPRVLPDRGGVKRPLTMKHTKIRHMRESGTHENTRISG